MLDHVKHRIFHLAKLALCVMLCIATLINLIPNQISAAEIEPVTGIVIVSNPLDITCKEGDTAEFAVEAAGNNLKYQWYKSTDKGGSWNRTYYTGYNTDRLSLTVAAYMNGYMFRCLLTDAKGNTITCEAAEIRMAAVEITIQPLSTTCREGDIANFIVEASGYNLKYQWYKSIDGGKNWSLTYYTGYNTNTLSLSAIGYMNRYLFRCIVIDAQGNAVTSGEAELRIAAAEITTQPEDIICKDGDVVSFSLEATGYNLKYQWYKSIDGGKSWSLTYYTGYKTNTISLTAAGYMHDYLFQCVVTDAQGNAATSKAAKLRITAAEIIAQPEDVTCKAGETAKFGVEATGYNLKYQWYKSIDGGKSWSLTYYTGYNTNTISVLAADYMDSYTFRCLVTDAQGNTATSEAAEMIIQKFYITKQPENIECELGDLVYFKVEVSGKAGIYQWFESMDGDTWNECTANGYNTDTINVIASEEIRQMKYRCEIKNADGNTIISNSANIIIQEQAGTIKLYNRPEINTLSGNTGTGTLLDCETSIRIAGIEDTANISASYVVNGTIEPQNLVFIHFAAISKTHGTKIRITISGTAFSANYNVPTNLTDFYVPVCGYANIGTVAITVIGECKGLSIYNFEVVNYYSSYDLKTLKAGLYDLSDHEIVAYAESDAISKNTVIASICDDRYIYELINGTDQLIICDIEDLSAISTLNGLGNVRDIAINEDSSLLVITSRENGAYIVDISAKESPVILSHYDTLELASGVDIDGNYAFVCSRYFGIEIIDISNPANPVFKSLVRGNTEYIGCHASDGFLYVGVWSQRCVEVYDISDVSAPVWCSTFSVDGQGYGVDVQDGILCVATGFHSQDSSTDITSVGYGQGNGVEIYDISDPHNPKWLSTVKSDGRFYITGYDIWKVDIIGDYIYYTDSYNGLYVYDITNPSSPQRVGHYTIRIEKTSSNYNALTNTKYIAPYNSNEYGQDVVLTAAVSEGKFFIFGIKTGVYKYTADWVISNSADEGSIYTDSGNFYGNNNLEIDGYQATVYSTSTQIYAAVEDDGLIYAACGLAGIQILDNNLNHLYSYNTETSVKDIIVRNGYIYTAEAENGVAIYRIASEKLIKVGSYNITLYSRDFSQLTLSDDGKYLMVQASWIRNGVIPEAHIIDVSNPQNPKYVSVLTTNSAGMLYFRNLIGNKNGNSVFGVEGTSRMRYYTVKEGKLSLVNELNNSLYSEANGGTVYNDNIIMIYKNGYVVFDPYTITQSGLGSLKVHTISGISLKGKVSASDGIMVVSNAYTGGVDIINIADLENPSLIAHLQIKGSPDIAFISEDSILIAGRYQGLIKLTKSGGDIEIPDGSYNIKDFGAKGDGVTDDTEAIEAALIKANGNPVIFPAGTYRVSSVDLTGINICIIGYGNPIIKKNSMAAEGTLVFRNCSSGYVSGITIDALRTEYGLDYDLACLYFYSSSNITIKDCHFQNSSREATAFLNSCENIHIDSCTFDNTSAIVWVNDGSIKHLLVENCTARNGRINGIEIDSKKGAGSTDVIIRNNSFYDIKTAGLYIRNVTDMTVEGNYTEGSKYFILMTCDTDGYEDGLYSFDHININDNRGSAEYFIYTYFPEGAAYQIYNKIVTSNNNFSAAKGISVSNTVEYISQNDTITASVNPCLRLTYCNNVDIIGQTLISTAASSYLIMFSNVGNTHITDSSYESARPLYGVVATGNLKLYLINVKANFSGITFWWQYNPSIFAEVINCTNTSGTMAVSAPFSGIIQVPAMEDSFICAMTDDSIVKRLNGYAYEGRTITLAVSGGTLTLLSDTTGNIIVDTGTAVYPEGSIITLIYQASKWHVVGSVLYYVS